MTRDQAAREARKRWGKRAYIRAGDRISRPEDREAARARRTDLVAKRDRLIAERDARLAALDWLQEMNREIADTKTAIRAAVGIDGYYKFAVGFVDNVIGAFNLEGWGDTWEEAFANAAARREAKMIRRGQYVRTWFDTGAMGPTILYGLVVAAGPRAFSVPWESGIVNRIRQDDAGGLTRISPTDLDPRARAALRNP